MGKRRRLKGAKPDAKDAAFERLAASVREAGANLDEVAATLPGTMRGLIEDAVRPYQALLAQQERDALAAEHPGWKAVNPNVFPAVLV